MGSPRIKLANRVGKLAGGLHDRYGPATSASLYRVGDEPREPPILFRCVFSEGAMKYIRSALVGIGVGIVVISASAALAAVHSYHRQELAWGSVVSIEPSVGPAGMLFGVLGFAIGFFWMLRRTQTSNQNSN